MARELLDEKDQVTQEATASSSPPVGAAAAVNRRLALAALASNDGFHADWIFGGSRSLQASPACGEAAAAAIPAVQRRVRLPTAGQRGDLSPQAQAGDGHNILLLPCDREVGVHGRRPTGLLLRRPRHPVERRQFG